MDTYQLKIACAWFVQNKKGSKLSLKTFDFVGGPTWARTKDPLIMSQVLLTS